MLFLLKKQTKQPNKKNQTYIRKKSTKDTRTTKKSNEETHQTCETTFEKARPLEDSTCCKLFSTYLVHGSSEWVTTPFFLVN
jgi:hypothetical protein